MTHDEVEQILQQPINTWPINPLICVLWERTQIDPEETLKPIFNIKEWQGNLLHFPYTATHIARNKAALALLSMPQYDCLVMLDSDHEHDPFIVHKLVANMMLDQEVKVVGGLNFQRKPPYSPCFYAKDEKGSKVVPLTWPDTLFSVDVLGTGSIAIHRTVFTQLTPPWFWYDPSGFWDDYFPGEDVWFSDLCK